MHLSSQAVSAVHLCVNAVTLICAGALLATYVRLYDVLCTLCIHLAAGWMWGHGPAAASPAPGATPGTGRSPPLPVAGLRRGVCRMSTYSEIRWVLVEICEFLPRRGSLCFRENCRFYLYISQGQLVLFTCQKQSSTSVFALQSGSCRCLPWPSK